MPKKILNLKENTLLLYIFFLYTKITIKIKKKKHENSIFKINSHIPKWKVDASIFVLFDI